MTITCNAWKLGWRHARSSSRVSLVRDKFILVVSFTKSDLLRYTHYGMDQSRLLAVVGTQVISNRQARWCPWKTCHHFPVNGCVSVACLRSVRRLIETTANQSSPCPIDKTYIPLTTVMSGENNGTNGVHPKGAIPGRRTADSDPAPVCISGPTPWCTLSPVKTNITSRKGGRVCFAIPTANCCGKT